ncbi:MAG TPA: PIG-L family deacetylase [Methanoregulaceae archaeon]|nr:PIG-L family deacetylase [Methanoregulaceae archaeon]
MRVLAFGAHPDDLEIGMGGTIARYTSRGHEVLMVIATVPNRKESRICEAKEAAEVLGARLVVMDIVPDELVFSREIVRRFDTVFNDFAPDVVYTHSNKDSHQDSAAVPNAVIATTRKNDCSVYMYEQTIPGGIAPNPFHGQYYVDISDTIGPKLDSIMKHRTQLDTYGPWWLEGIKGRAMYHGFRINVKYAEVFEVIKDLARW